MRAGGRLRLLLVAAAWAGPCLWAGAARGGAEPSAAYLLTIGTSPLDQRPVEGILVWWSTPLDGPQPLVFTRTFDFADPLEAYQEAPGTLQEAVLRRANPAPARPFETEPRALDVPAGLRLDGIQVADWSLRLVDGVPNAAESVEIQFATAEPWRPFELVWPWK
jgi:hypothetical protein